MRLKRSCRMTTNPRRRQVKPVGINDWHLLSKTHVAYRNHPLASQIFAGGFRSG